MFWFYYGDLLDAILNVIDVEPVELDLYRSDENPAGVFKIVLGNIEYVDKATNRPTLINLARVPISLELWEEFWFKYVVQRGSLNYYLKDFLKDSMTVLIKAALTNRHRMSGEPGIDFYPSVQQINVPYEKFNRDHKISTNIYNNFIYETGQGADKGSPRGDEVATDQRIFFMFNGRDTFGIGSRKGDSGKAEDNRSGIYHIALGQQNTPVHNVSFTKSEIAHWIEWQAFKSGFLQENIHLSEPYKCDLELPGLSFVRPGAYTYIRFPISWFGSPQTPGSYARALGLGGYFLITRASNTLVLLPSGGKLEWRTTASTEWESFGNEMRSATIY